jgi:hypothetical protein
MGTTSRRRHVAVIPGHGRPIRPTRQRGQRRDGGRLPFRRGFTLTLVPARQHNLVTSESE